MTTSITPRTRGLVQVASSATVLASLLTLVSSVAALLSDLQARLLHRHQYPNPPYSVVNQDLILEDPEAMVVLKHLEAVSSKMVSLQHPLRRLFSSTQSSTGRLFEGAQPAASSLFGSQARPGGLFGGGNGPLTGAAPSLFGSTQSATGGLFGGNGHHTQPAPSLFGSELFQVVSLVALSQLRAFPVTVALKASFLHRCAPIRMSLSTNCVSSLRKRRSARRSLNSNCDSDEMEYDGTLKADFGITVL